MAHSSRFWLEWLRTLPIRYVIRRPKRSGVDLLFLSAALLSVEITSQTSGENRRSLHFAPLDFRLRLAALAKCIRLSLRKAGPVALFGFAK